jgi:hypothetical protein
MPRIWSATDGFHWASDSMMEQFGNAANYNVVDGCAASYSGSNLQVTVASGVITHNGTQVSVPGNTVTLVADGSNPRFTWVAINSSGVAVIVSGTAAADPTEPEVGDNVEVALVKVAAGGTIASSQDADDRRMFAARDSETDANGLDSSVTSLNSTTLANVSGLSAAVAANSIYAFRALVNYYAAAANDYKFGFTIPASATIHAIVEYVNTSQSAVLGNLTASGGSLTAHGFGAATAGTVVISGAVITAGTAGNLQFQHAQGTAGATVTTLEKSRLEVF